MGERTTYIVRRSGKHEVLGTFVVADVALRGRGAARMSRVEDSTLHGPLGSAIRGHSNPDREYLMCDLKMRLNNTSTTGHHDLEICIASWSTSSGQEFAYAVGKEVVV